ncbi:ABC transporter permease [Nocardioides acrostichi]|uniref:Iron ABC transporter permease n=1 Tax=Nocardioides acrostichi TaxID=2784339 RepID=A0A930V033_9ACTN|nr:ABC transporter permease subunit [Nocardioides acrostichi]MBF4161401.1 iron ABC transporter permease [Nocardioides acrostichi]
MTAKRLAGLGALATLPLAVLCVFFVLPVSGMIERGFVADGHLDIGGVLEVFTRSRTHQVLWFTVWSATAATMISVGLGVPVAYVLYRLDFPGRRLVRAALLVPFVLPTVVVGVAFRELLVPSGLLGGLGLDGSKWAIVAGLVFFNASVVIRSVGASWESLDTRPAQAAAALGATPAQVFRTVTLPSLRPAIVSAASVVFLFCATAFGIVLILGGLKYSSVESEIYFQTTVLLDLRAAAALSILQLLAVLVLLVLAGRLRRVPDPTVSRTTAGPRRPRLADAPWLGATALLLGAVALPIGTLVAGSLQVQQADGAQVWGLENYRALSGEGSNAALAVPVTQALSNSLRIAVDATWMSLLLGGLLALVVTRRSRSRAERRVRSVLDGFFMLPLGVSAVTLGFGFLITLDHGVLDLRDSRVLIPLAQALVALPLVVRTLVPVLAGIDDRLRQAAASLGAGPVRAVLTVDLPVVWRPLLAAAGFAFAVSLGEFGATSFLARPDRPTLPVVIYRLLGHPGRPNYGMALAGSVVLALTVALVMLVVERLRVRSLGVI